MKDIDKEHELLHEVQELMNAIEKANKLACDLIEKQDEINGDVSAFVHIATYFIAAYMLLGMSDPDAPEQETPREYTLRLIDNKERYRSLLNSLIPMYLDHLRDVVANHDLKDKKKKNKN